MFEPVSFRLQMFSSLLRCDDLRFQAWDHELYKLQMSNTQRFGHHINFTLPDDIPSATELPSSCTSSRLGTSPSLKQTFFNYIGKGLEQLGRMKSPPPRPQDPTLQFRGYLENISTEMQRFKKNRRTKEKARQIAIENVQSCYQKIPPVYFKEDFDFICLPNRKKIRANQQQLGNHLDMVELTLFSQVTANFNQYLGLMSAMDDLDVLIDNGIQKVVNARSAIKLTQKSFLAKAARIQMLLQKRNSLQKTLEAAVITKRLGSISQELRATMSKGTWDKEVFTAISSSIKQWEIVRKVQAISRFGSEIDKLQNQGKYYLKQQIQMGMLLLIQPSLKYSKQKWISQGVPKNAVIQQDNAQNNTINMSVEITVLDQSYFDQNQEQDHEQQDSNQIEKLCGIIGFCCDLGYYQNNVWYLLEGKLAHFNDQFFKDVKQYLSFILQRSGNVGVKNNWTLNKLLEYIEIGFYCKIVFAYFQIIKKVFLKLNTLIEMTAGNGFLNELQKGMNEFIMTQLKLFLGLKKVSSNTDYQTFLKYLSIIDFWIQSQSDLICLNLKSLDQTRHQLIDFYITNVHKQVLTVELKQAMEADKFTPCPIPSDYYHQLDYLFNGGNEQESFNANDQTFNLSICRDRRSNKKIMELEESTNNSKVRVMNKVLNVNGQSYMVCESFLLLLEILEEYVQMAACMPSHKHNIEEKINELIGFYNWYLKELVLNAGIIKFSSSIKTVMVKHMCLEMHLVQLMQIILPRIPVEKPDPKKKLETALKAHQADVNKKISTVIVYRLQDQIAVLYQSRINDKNPVPVQQSKNIIAVISNAKQTLYEFFAEEKVKQLLSNAVKMVNKGYFNYLLSLGKRGFSELDWFLTESEKTYSELFGDEITEMKQEMKKRRR